MSEAEPPKPRKNALIALKRSEAEIDRLARVTEDDIREGKRYWRRKALPKYRGLLDAKPTTGNPNQ